MKSRNKCNHRDYQNIGHNGGRMRSLVEQIKALGKTDKPYLAFVHYIGNDVCGDNLGHMTKPAELETQMNAGLQLLDTVAKPNTKVFFVGMVDGRVLWEVMSNLIHPLGVPYRNVYQFLTCSNANPCWTWLNTNETVRNATSFRAAELSETISRIVTQSKGKYKNLELAYKEFPLPEALEYAKKQGIPLAKLIEPMDGFHPSHLGHNIFAELIWEYLQNNLPHFIGPFNDNNSKIAQIFGDQGGY